MIESRCYRADEGFYADAATSDNADAALFMMINWDTSMQRRRAPIASP